MPWGLLSAVAAPRTSFPSNSFLDSDNATGIVLFSFVTVSPRSEQVTEVFQHQHQPTISTIPIGPSTLEKGTLLGGNSIHEDPDFLATSILRSQAQVGVICAAWFQA
jgi:hypothetical protein